MTTTLENLSQHGVRWCVDFAPSAVDFPWAPSVGGSSAGGDIQRCLSDTGIDPVIRRPNRWPRQKRLCCFLMGTTAGWGVDRTGFSSGRVTPLIMSDDCLTKCLLRLVRSGNPSRCQGGCGPPGVAAERTLMLLPDLPRAGRTGYSPLDTRRPNPPLPEPPLLPCSVGGVRGGSGFTDRT